MLPFLQRSRMNSIYGPPRPLSQPKTGYGIYDEFLSSIAPFVDERQASEERNQMQDFKLRRRALDRQNEFTPGVPFPPRDVVEQPETVQQRPKNVVFNPGISPYQEATLGLRERELASREGLAERKQTEVERKTSATEQDRAKRTKLLEDKQKLNTLTDAEEIELRGLKQSEQITQRGDITSRQIVERGQQARTTAELRAMLETQLINLRGDNTMRGIERRAELQQDLEEIKAQERREKPLAPSQEKTNIQLRYNRLINKKPQYRDFVSINPDTGMVEVAEESKPGRFFGTTSGPTKEQREEILKELGMSGQKTEGTKEPESETVEMIDDEGNEYDIPKDKVEDALKNGLKRRS